MQPSYTLENLIKGLGKEYTFSCKKKNTFQGHYFVDDSKGLENVLKKYQKDL